jgi:uncharacterized protein YdaU (DUF1376 family)
MAPEDRPSMPWYVKDWLSSEDRARMTYEARGVYRDLLDYAWLHRGIPTNKRTVANWLGITERKLALLWGMMAHCWHEQDDRYINRKQEEVRQELDDYREGKREAGRRGGKARAERLAEAKQNGSSATSNDVANVKPSSASASSSAIAFASSKELLRSSQQQPRYAGMSHTGHVFGFCDFKCLSEQKIREFSQDLPGGATEPNFEAALSWAKSVRDQWGDKPKLEPKWYEFWEARWRERLASVSETSTHDRLVKMLEGTHGR